MRAAAWAAIALLLLLTAGCSGTDPEPASRAPEGWKRAQAPADFLLEAWDPDSRGTILLSDLEAEQEAIIASVLATVEWT